MKYILILGDGMSDYPIERLGGRTPLMAAKTPAIDFLVASGAEVGLVKTIPDGFKPGSDTANLSVLGYQPEKYYTGRSPLEAVSLGIDMDDGDVAVRCNLVTLSRSDGSIPSSADIEAQADGIFESLYMDDYSAGEITSADAKELILAVNEALGDAKFQFYPGVSYRHCLIVKDGKLGTKMTPPHDISGKPIKEYLPSSGYADIFLEMYKTAFKVLSEHPVNKRRIAEGKKPGNSVWFWGEGTKPSLDSFLGRFGKKGAMISAVDLLKGIARAADMTVCDVPGATATIDTDYEGKANAAIDALESGHDFVYVHIEAPDESGHHGNLEEKIMAIELIDQRIIKPLVAHFAANAEDFAVLVLPDHPTPLSTRTHASDPVPYLMWQSGKILAQNPSYDEKSAKESGVFKNSGYELIKHFLALE